MNFKDLWNSQADHQNQWDSLSEDEKLEFVAAHEREECIQNVLQQHEGFGTEHQGVEYVKQRIVEAIRARGKA
jgi:hypothetical protein